MLPLPLPTALSSQATLAAVPLPRSGHLDGVFSTFLPDLDFAFGPGLVAFALVIAFSPGPSNIVLLGIGATHGVRRGLPVLIGMALGYAALWAAASSGLRALAEVDPGIVRLAHWVAAVFVVWVAFRMAKAPASSASAPMRHGIWSGFAFQGANPKAWISAGAAAALFCSTNTDVPGHAVSFGLAAGLAIMIGCGAWLVLGQWGGGWLRRPGPRRVLDGALAATLLATLVPLVWTA